MVREEIIQNQPLLIMNWKIIQNFHLIMRFLFFELFLGISRNHQCESYISLTMFIFYIFFPYVFIIIPKRSLFIIFYIFKRSKMGQCGGCSNNRSQKMSLGTYWKQPEDTEQYSHLQLPKLQFQGSLSNFKIKNCSFPALSIKIEIKGVQIFYLRQKPIRQNQTAKWSFQQNFGFIMTQYELRKSFLSVEFNDERQIKVGQIFVNMYLISTGPYHQDFSVKLKNNQNARINFDIKISQIIQIQMNSTFTQIDLKTKHPGEKFMYSIKTIVHNLHLSNSSPSYKVRVMLDNKEKENSESGDSENGKEIEEGKNIAWIKEDNLFMPSVSLKILVSEIYHSYFQILFWKVNEKFMPKQRIKETPQLYGQCYIALHKLMKQQYTLIKNQDGKTLEEHNIQIKEKIWHHGQKIGDGIFKFIIRNDTFLKQMPICVRTEGGIMNHSPVFGKQSEKQEICEELKELLKLGEGIESDIISLKKIQAFSSIPNIEIRKLLVNIEKSLQKVKILLHKSSKESIIFYRYSSEKQLMKSQKILIQFGHKILNYLEEEEDQIISQIYWQILIALMRRGEFLLAHIGFDQQSKEKIKIKNVDKKLSHKIQIALLYKQFLYQLLVFALNSFNAQGLQYEKTFAETFSAYAYFRIPHFRTKVLEAIIKQDDPQIIQWRGTQFSLQNYNQNDEMNKEELNAFAILFDWGSGFHKCLENEEKNQDLDYSMSELLKKKEWKERISKRSTAFFYFVKYWVEYISSIAIKTKDIQWKYFPGYHKLIKCFLAELKKRSILQYPTALKQASFSLLLNQKLLNSFVSITYNKANLYDQQTITKAIQFISDLFNCLDKNGRKIPANFNYVQFYKGLKLILESDFSFAISKVLLLIYNHFSLFSMEFQKSISMYLLGKIFFLLFLHWSNNVRNIFHHLILLRIYRQSIEIAPEQSIIIQQHSQNKEEIRVRYKKLMVVLENAQKVKKEEDKMGFALLYEKDLYKKLKKNLYQKKKRRRKNAQVAEQVKANRKDLKNISEGYSSAVFQQKYAISKLYKNNQNERFKSELIKPTIELVPVVVEEKVDEVKRTSKKSIDFRHQIYDTIKGKDSIISCSQKINQFDEADFQIGKISPHSIKYLSEALLNFDKIHKLLAEHINEKNWEVPKINMEMPLDGKEIKPEKIDDW